MSLFSERELAYLVSQRLGRLATVSADGAPHVVPVGFRYRPEHDAIDIIGQNLAMSKKVRDLQHDPRVAFVVDDVLPPWKPRGIEIRGQATLIRAIADPTIARDTIRIIPSIVIAWGIETDPYQSITKRAPSLADQEQPSSGDIARHSADPVEEASLESFPASDPPAR